MDFTGKTAFITGGGGFLGSEIARTLARRGASVAVCDLNTETVQKTVDSITATGGKAIALLVDVTEPASIESAMEQTESAFGDIDISIHVAGGSARIAGPNVQNSILADREDYVIDRVLKVNLYGAIYVARAAARRMRDRNSGGRIISFASTVGVNGLKGAVEYAAAKGGIMSMTKALAKEMGGYKVTVNAVAPGVVARPEQEGNYDYSYNTNFLKEKCTAADVANLTAFLASDEAGFITGQTYIIDGGRSLAMKGTDV